jgi:hypothetical protein
VDTQNVLALTLTPGAQLVDPAKPVKVVWNGELQTAILQAGQITLRAKGDQASALEKNTRLAGPIGDIFNTPFAIVTGSASTDPAMNEVCRQKAQALVNFWQEWQRQPPRVFKDSELSDADAERYSLILIGGPDTNLIARKLADRLPLNVSGAQIAIDGRAFVVTDTRIQMIYPNPLNAHRYVLVIAATSATGMSFWSPNGLRNAQFDFTIEDGHIANLGQPVSTSDIWVAGGWFSRAWQRDDKFVVLGKPDERAKGLVLRGPPERKLLETYAGNYEINPGTIVKVTRIDTRLFAKVGEAPSTELIPAGEDKFYVAEGPSVIVFEKDPAARVNTFKVSQYGQEFVAKRVE